MASDQQPQFVGTELQIGKKLTDARRKQKLRLNNVARELNIKESYLKALEEDDYASIPGRAYALGFLRTYAERLELDADKFVKEVQESGVLVGDPFYDMPTPVEEGGLPTRQVMLIALAALVVVGLSMKGWQMYSNRVPTEAVVVDEIANVAPIAVVEEQEPAPIVVAKAPESKGEVVVKAAEPVKTEPAKAEPVKKVEAPAAPKAEVAKVEEPKAAEPEAPAVVAIPEKPAGARILLQAKGNDVWLQIRRPSNNRVLVSRTLADGEGYWVRNWSDMVIDTGRPHHLAVQIDDVELGMLNTAAAVKDLRLEADYLKNEYFAQGLNTKRLPEPVKVEEAPAEQAAAAEALATPVQEAEAIAPVAEEEGATPEPTEAPAADAEKPKVNPLAMPPMRW